MDFSGKTVLVTGATSGIGLGIAEVFAQKNANVLINGFGTPMEISNVVGALSQLGSGKVMHCASDLSKLEDIEMLVEFGRDTFGGIDILVNNAGIQHVAPIDEFPLDKWDLVLNLNLTSCFHLIRLCLPGMRQKSFGRIINIASAHGLVASAGKSAYVAAKHGLLGLTKVVALETARENITCNAICPGWVLTPLVQKQIDMRAEKEGISVDKAKDDLVGEKQPSYEFVTPEQLGEFAAFLASDAAKQMRGACMPMDGGWTAQ